MIYSGNSFFFQISQFKFFLNQKFNMASDNKLGHDFEKLIRVRFKLLGEPLRLG